MRRKTAKKSRQQTGSSSSGGDGGGAGTNAVAVASVDEKAFLSAKISCAEFWQSVKRAVVLHAPDKQTCVRWGAIMLRAWKNGVKAERQPKPENRQVPSRESIESDMLEELFYCSVLTKRPLSQRFTNITDAFLEVEKPTKKFRAMLFRCTMPVLWRNLEVPNQEVRHAASLLILKFFPLVSDDEFIRDEYLDRQRQAMTRMLMDECVPLRVAAVKKVPKHLNGHWDSFPREHIKQLLGNLVDQLSLDSVPEVRAAVYEGFSELLRCPAALNATQHSLKILGKRGIHDKSERVRLAAFKMLNQLHGHRFIKVFDKEVITWPDCLHRLDYELSGPVQNQIVRLLFRPLCPHKMEGIDILERFKRISYVCKHSRNASLHFHRLVYTLELMPIQFAVQHIRSLLLGVKMLLRKCSGSENSADDTADTTLLNITGASTFLSEQMAGEPDEKLTRAKDVLDSAIVLWISIRYDLFNAQYAKENGEVIKLMSSILHSLDNFSATPLMDSAMVIASYLPKDKIGRLFNRIRAKLETEEATNFYFPHYVEALAFWDMNKLIELIERGLKKLRNAVVSACDTAEAEKCATPRRRRRQQHQRELQGSVSRTLSSASSSKTSVHDSPQAKRARIAVDETVEQRRPLELIRMLLASPQTSAFLKGNFGVYLEGFFESLCVIRYKFGDLLLSAGWEAKFDARTLISAYETFNIVALITKQIEQPRRSSQGEEVVNEAELALPVPDRVLYNELKWFANILPERTPSFQVIEMFLRCISLHMCASQLGAMVLNETANMLNELRHRLETAFDARSVILALRKCVENLEEALEGCEEREQAQRVMERKIRPMQQFFEAEEQRENTESVENDDDEGGV